MEVEQRLEPEYDHDPHLQTLHHLLIRRQMMAPVLLFVTGHQPLAFVTGHLLLLLAPLAHLLGWSGVTPLAGALVEPGAMARMESILRKSVDLAPETLDRQPPVGGQVPTLRVDLPMHRIPSKASEQAMQ